MASGNKGFADLVSGGMARPAARLPPRTGILGARENRLAEIASGAAVARVHESIDPARCRIWDGHNRDYAALSETVCADLIESFRAQGRQEVPAIVRRVSGDPAHEFEVICGARRHWTVSWLRANTYPDFKFLIEPRELTDEEAFRLADLENRSRKDLSDYERATDYARAIERYYGGSQQKMVERLDVSKSWLSRYLELARLPDQVIRSFGSPHQIGISHAAALAPLLRAPKTRERVLAEAELLARDGRGGAPAAVVRRLVGAAAGKPAKRRAKEVEVRDAAGAVVAKALRSSGGALSITVPGFGVRARPDVLAALAELLEKIG
ncbi:ParB/RepB/Spo0J family partition protein [Acidisphaera sp. L21]|uniref:ParB/RepB/Spo0J family partition protein n=1 Tax=Acidisphaera sp. L21 TaxID=1641851 RepID=UPI00131BC639|nr:ParB/RepB/Spo0J family partition protein [Acidisphaera sp. L21]